MDIVLKYFSEFTSRQLEQLKSLEVLYNEWNQKINVISRKDIESLYEKHVLHSLSIAALFDFGRGSQILDLGTGGGFPGIPLAIYFPDVQFHLADSIGKKLKVVDAIAQTIGLSNLTTQHIRAEEIKNRKFDFVVSRAVAPLKDLWKWSKPLIRRDTATDNNALARNRPGLICLKGGDLTQEVADSGLRPYVTNIYDVFPEEYFKEKYVLYVPR